MHAMQKQV